MSIVYRKTWLLTIFIYTDFYRLTTPGLFAAFTALTCLVTRGETLREYPNERSF